MTETKTDCVVFNREMTDCLVCTTDNTKTDCGIQDRQNRLFGVKTDNDIKL